MSRHHAFQLYPIILTPTSQNPLSTSFKSKDRIIYAVEGEGLYFHPRTYTECGLRTEGLATSPRCYSKYRTPVSIPSQRSSSDNPPSPKKKSYQLAFEHLYKLLEHRAKEGDRALVSAPCSSSFSQSCFSISEGVPQPGVIL